jgi:hypothetical protein
MVLVLATFIAGVVGITGATGIPATAAMTPFPTFPVRRIVELLLMYFPVGFALPMVFAERRSWYVLAAGVALAMSLSASGLAILNNQGVHLIPPVPRPPLLPFLPARPFLAEAALAAAGSVAGAWAGGVGWMRFRSHYWRGPRKSAEIWSSMPYQDYRRAATKIPD